MNPDPPAVLDLCMKALILAGNALLLAVGALVKVISIDRRGTRAQREAMKGRRGE